MSSQNDQTRTYTQLSKAWYGKSAMPLNTLDQISIKAEGTPGEVTIEWISVGKNWAAQIRVFDDSWETLSKLSDLTTALAELNGRYQTPDQVAELIEGLGIENRTETEQ